MVSCAIYRIYTCVYQGDVGKVGLHPLVKDEVVWINFLSTWKYYISWFVVVVTRWNIFVTIHWMQIRWIIFYAPHKLYLNKPELVFFFLKRVGIKFLKACNLLGRTRTTTGTRSYHLGEINSKALQKHIWRQTALHTGVFFFCQFYWLDLGY